MDKETSAIDEVVVMVVSKADKAVILYVSPVNPEDRARLVDARKIHRGRPTNKMKLAGFGKLVE